MPELIEHYSGTDVAVWNGDTYNTQYLLGTITLTPGYYYITFSKSGTLPGREGGLICYQYVAKIPGLVEVGHLTYDASTSHVFQVKSTNT